MNYPEDMDPLIIPLCDAINELPETQTKFSCQGHASSAAWNREAYVLIESKRINCVNLLIEAFSPVLQMLNSEHKDKIGDWDYDAWGVELDYEDNECEDSSLRCVQDRNTLRVCFRRKTLHTTDEETKQAFDHKIWRIKALRAYYCE